MVVMYMIILVRAQHTYCKYCMNPAVTLSIECTGVGTDPAEYTHTGSGLPNTVATDPIILDATETPANDNTSRM